MKIEIQTVPVDPKKKTNFNPQYVERIFLVGGIHKIYDYSFKLKSDILMQIHLISQN